MKGRSLLSVGALILGIWLILGLKTLAAAEGPVNISQRANGGRSPAIAITADGTIHMAWEEADGVYYRRFSNGTWTNVEQISVGGQHPQFLVDRVHQNTVYLVWDEPFGDGQDIFIRRWQDGAWGLPRNVSQTEGYSSQPTIAQHADGTLVLVWSDTTPGQPTLYRATSTDGDVWMNAAPLTEMVGAEPHVVILNGQEHIFWLYRPSFREPRQLLWSRFDGSRWTPPSVLSGTFSVVSMDVIADESFHVLWLIWNESGDVYVRSWNGTTWSNKEALSHDGIDSVAFAAPRAGLPAALWVETGKIRRGLRQGTQWNIQDWWQTTAPLKDITATTAYDRVYVAWAQGDTTSDVWMYRWFPRATYIPFLMK